ncbi:substrate-binding domain-containing protein [Pseudoduganella sp. DS3]|uniref:Substrate-binding domain-containing protein n=1 Tax=Pseudoduganella guangdongensis TaxID=2692179 RepID=A0A6N9HJA1_9BURK|nr:LacI family DNA-binding transcriptional regulator [Pseudoduganella guangdongensis]MYN03701.1 substrate-binding domain-containing protein [Pseudoduganella guangdongensis]
MRATKPKTALNAVEQKAIILQEGRRVTSYDVALVAGVSQSAVSRCFKPGASVSKSTYARVMKAAECLEYIPNAAARSLITRRSNIVAIVVSHSSMLYNPAALSELSQQLNRRGKRALLFTMQHEGEIEGILNDLWQFQVDGVVAASTVTAAHVAEFKRRQVPLVVFNRHLRDLDVNSVLCDQQEAARVVVSRLAAAGHRQLAIIGGPSQNSIARERLRGALERITELGLPEAPVFHGQFDYASGVAGLHELIARIGAVPDAVMCANDAMAMGCVDAARQHLHIDVPSGMSVVGFDAVEGSNWLSYELTTVRQPLHKMAVAAADLLCNLIEADGVVESEKRVFAAQFVEGETALLVARKTALAA